MASQVGKGKGKADNDIGPQHGSTLFVSNLPYTATSVDLQTLFSDIAPVRTAFVVTEHGTGISKGVGYVSFALKEDAENAYTMISEDGMVFVGRKLRVQWAENQKNKEKGGHTESVKEVKQKISRPKVPRLPHDPLAIRTILISGLPTSIDSKVLWKKIRKYGGVEKIEWPIKSGSEGEDCSSAHILFSTPAQAASAVTKLHAHIYKGSLLSVTLKKRLDSLSKPPNASEKGGKSSNGPAPSHASRLIVRNIPFNATEQDLRAIFLPYGPIHSIHIPTDEKSTAASKEEDQVSKDGTSATRTPRTKGFGFVWMLSKKDAEKAIQGCNGTVMRAGTAQSLVLDKQKKKKEKRLEMKRLKAMASGEREPGGEAGDVDVEEERKVMERVIAVDWALSKDKWEEEKTKLEDVKMDVSSESASSSSDDDGDDGATDDDASDTKSESDGGGSQVDDEDNEGERVKPQLPPPETGTTVFVRNIPFDATEDELRTLFRSFGPLRYARITKDLATDRSRGTGFACFWNKEDADRAVQQSELLRAETTGEITTSMKNPFSMPSILTPDPSAGLAQSLVLHGRTLDVVKAVTRDVAGKLKEENERARQKVDKRNMYLLKEGVILPNSPSAETLTPAEVERRTSSFNARRALLKSNPSLYISRTRLSVRQIPTFTTEKMLKRLALHSIKAFDAEVRQGKRDTLSADELADAPTSNSGDALSKSEELVENDDIIGRKKNKFKGKESAVKQAKVVRQTERVDPITGKGKSKGYGFVEMYKHSDALKFLRWANNNPEVGKLLGGQWWKDELENLLKVEKAKDEATRDDARLKRLKDEIGRVTDGDDKATKQGRGTLIVEFSIENVQVVQRRNANLKDRKEKAPTSPYVETKDKKRKREPEDVHVGTTPDTDQPTKTRRLSLSMDTKSKKTTFANPVGSIIGRKRKERKKGNKV